MEIDKSKKRIAFYFDRSVIAKFYAPVIIELLNRNFEVFFICGPMPHSSWSDNPGYRPLKENIKIPSIDKIKFIYFDKFKEVESIVIESGITDLFVTHAINHDQEVFISEMKKRGLKINCIQWAADYLVITPDKLKMIDNLFIHSLEMKEIYFRHFPEALGDELDLKFISVGNPIFDCLKENRTKDFLLQKYGIPKGKKIVLLMALNLTVLPWAKYYFGSSNKLQLFLNFLISPSIKYLKEFLKFGGYRDQLLDIKKWCKKNNASLVIKSRPKHKEPRYVSEIADVFISDEEFYPLASVELVSISDLVIGYESTVVLEAGFLGVRAISINIDMESKISWRRTLPEYTKSGIYGYKGLSDVIDYHDVNEYLNNRKLSGFNVDSKKREEYVEKFIGFDDFNSSKRIVDYILGV